MPNIINNQNNVNISFHHTMVKVLPGRFAANNEQLSAGSENSQIINPKPVRSYNAVALAYAEMLKKYDPMWKWYGHFTYRFQNTKHGSCHPEKAEKLFRKLIDKINIDSFGRNYKRSPFKGALVARSTEIGDKGGLLHHHGLLGNIPDRVASLNMEYKEVWNGLAGFARIYPYDCKLGGAAYLCKSAYAWKRGEIDFIGPWDRVDQIMRESYSIPEIFAVSVS
jgi:hypothetical protein